MNRVDALRKVAFKEDKFDGYAVFNGINLTYLAGFSGSSALLVPRDGESVLYVYGVNYEMAKAEGAGFRVERVERCENLMEKVAKQSVAFGIKRLAVDALSITNWRALAKSMGSEEKLVADNGVVQELRKIKGEEEIKLLRKAAELTSLGMKVAYETVAAGLKEYEVAAEIEYAMRKQGSGGTAFETIVASGACSAFPHGGCSDRKIRQGDLVVVDIGAAYRSYCSDMTRTLVAGKASEKQKRLYGIVKQAQDNAFATVKANVKAKDVDAAARQAIAEAGFGDYFVHNLGHGVGLEVHEPPTLSPESTDTLAVGNVVTVEPGIYLVGYGGIRIEDTVLVGKAGAEKLTSGPYALTKE
ncbi:aminopeptidase P family protein [Candidatus Bathyarchaeota archaeon A05DMB-2]|jgi:Xaa-Pro aminopeptidase|nr:aminopeptidase P family protein [Candidatus Bathyarchaeota archaeon A05DMB-2]